MMKQLIEVCIMVKQLEVRIIFDGEPTLEHVADAIEHVFAEHKGARESVCYLLSTLGASDLVLKAGDEAFFEQDEKRIGQLIVQPRILFEVS